MLSDLLLVTSVKKKAKAMYNKVASQSMDFLESNRFKLLFKIALEDVQISKGFQYLVSRLKYSVSRHPFPT